ncbi:MAG: DegT/DnrJ/EryC1/StrS family aminotransferase [Candidatus Cloacimonadia bacterium]
MYKFSPWPSFEEDEIRAVEEVLRSGRVNQWTGTEVTSFEKEFADYLGVAHAIALVNGSVALDLALSVLGIGPGDEVVVTPRSFVASASCIVLRGATPVFVDVDKDTQNITTQAVENAILSRTKAVIAVHLAGWPSELDKLKELCDGNGLFLIEDCAQAHGARHKGKPVGSFGDFAAFSFCQDKIMTTGGEGGMLVTNNKELWKRAWSFKDHGKDYDVVFHNEHPSGFRWLVKTFGTNYRMTEMQAAIGRIQLKKLDRWVEKRRYLASILSEGFKQFDALRVTCPPDDEYHSYYKYYVFVRPERLRETWSRDRILYELAERGIPCGTGICPEVYLEKAFDNYNWITGSGEKKRLEIAKQIGETSMMFLVHPTLDESDMHFIIEQMERILKEACI